MAVVLHLDLLRDDTGGPCDTVYTETNGRYNEEEHTLEVTFTEERVAAGDVPTVIHLATLTKDNGVNSYYSYEFDIGDCAPAPGRYVIKPKYHSLRHDDTPSRIGTLTAACGHERNCDAYQGSRVVAPSRTWFPSGEGKPARWIENAKDALHEKLASFNK